MCCNPKVIHNAVLIRALWIEDLSMFQEQEKENPHHHKKVNTYWVIISRLLHIGTGVSLSNMRRVTWILPEQKGALLLNSYARISFNGHNYIKPD